MTWSILKGSAAGSTGAVNVGLPTGWAENDYCFMVCESATGEAVSAPTDWTEVAGSPVDDGVSTRLTIFERRLTASETNPVPVADPGNHILAVTFAVRGATTTGSPIRASATQIVSTASATVFFPAVAGALEYDYILAICDHGRDASGSSLSNPYGADPDVIALDLATGDGTNQGHGGGAIVLTGTMEVDGLPAASIAATLGASLTQVHMVLALISDGSSAAQAEIHKGWLGMVVDTAPANDISIAKGWLGFVVDTDPYVPPDTFKRRWRANVN